MTVTLENTISILEHLVSFESISGRPTEEIVSYIQDCFSAYDITASLSIDQDDQRANVFATIGPEIDGGVLLNGHTDVVPVIGQNWSTDPFILTRKDDRLYGRGSVDMKGFLACVLASVPYFKAVGLKKPIHIAFSYDEETGGFGMPVLLESINRLPYKPHIVIIGEPTEMQIITGHKGSYEMRTEIVGHETHSSDPTKGVSAISIASKLIAKIDEIGVEKANHPILGSPFDLPYGTFNVGIIEGGTARNATAGWCNFDWQYRQMPNEDGSETIAKIEAYAAELIPAMKAINPNCDIRIITEVPAPGMDNKNAHAAAAFVSEITGINSQGVVSFGTDGGYFSAEGFSTVVFGPGSITRAHKPDEYITVQELVQGLAFLEKIADRLAIQETP